MFESARTLLTVSSVGDASFGGTRFEDSPAAPPTHNSAPASTAPSGGGGLSLGEQFLNLVNDTIGPADAGMLDSSFPAPDPQPNYGQSYQMQQQVTRIKNTVNFCLDILPDF